MKRISLVAALLLAVALIAFRYSPNRSPASPEISTVAPAEIVSSKRPVRGAPYISSEPAMEMDEERQPELPAAALPTPQPVGPLISPESRALVNALTSFPTHGREPLSEEQALLWRENYEKLIAMGPAGIPAVMGFIRTDTDLNFDLNTAAALGHGSARRAMFDALIEVGGSEGYDALRQVLRETASPREIAFLAKTLDSLAPGENREEMLQAARESLAMAKKRELGEADVAPLFEVFQRFGGPDTVTDLKDAAKNWDSYAAITLAKLPDGAGLPALVQMVQERGGGAGVTVLQMVAGAAAESPDARAVLLEKARSNGISPNLWAYLVHSLAGEELRYQNSELTESEKAGLRARQTSFIASTNERFDSVPNPNLTPDQLMQRISLVDELSRVVSDPTALTALNQAKDMISERIPSAQTTQ